VALLAIRNATHCMHVLSPAPPVPVQLYVGIKVGRPESQKKHMHWSDRAMTCTLASIRHIGATWQSLHFLTKHSPLCP